MIRVENVSKQFNKTRALKNVSLEVNKGDIISLIGPSGSGKSTLLRCIHGLEHVDTGKIYMDNEWMNPDDEKKFRTQRNRMGFVFQHFNLFPNMTVKENIKLAPVRLQKWTKEEADEKAVELLKRVGLEDKADTYPNKLSGGQKQRISIARIFLKNPPVLILDEATSALDSVTEAKIQETFDKLSQGRTTIVIAHRLSTVKNADRIAVIDEGRIIELGTDHELLESNGAYAQLVHTQELMK